MSKEITNFTRSHFDFVVKLSDSDGKKRVSREVVLSGIPWKVKIVKGTDGSEKILKAARICSPPKGLKLPSPLQWSCEAKANVSIRSVGKRGLFNAINISKTMFGSLCLSSKLFEIVRATDLTQYFENGRIVFRIQLFVNPLFIEEPSRSNSFHTKFQFVVDDVSRLGREVQYSSDTKMCGTTWKVSTRKLNNSLQVFLENERNNQNENWSWNAKCTFKLLPFDPTVPPIVKNIKKNFIFDENNWGYSGFVDWGVLLDPVNKYVQDDKIIFEIDLQVQPPKPLWTFDVNESEANSLEFPICLQSVRNRSPAATKCGHIFCYNCIMRSIQISTKCPNCNANAGVNDIRKIFI